MKKRRRVMVKRRKNGSTHVYLLMRVTLYLLYYLIVPHAYQRRMNVMFLWIFLKYLLWVKPVKVLIPLFLSLIEIIAGVRSMENKKILPHAHKQAKIYLLDCSNESIIVITLEDSKAVNESGFSWVM